MKTIYLECKMGIAGDMFASALLGLFADKDEMVSRLNAINVPGVTYKLENVTKCGICGDHLAVFVDGVEEESIDIADDDKNQGAENSVHEHNHEHDHHHGHEHDHEHHDHHDHHSLYDIEEIIEGLDVSKEVKSDIREVYELLAEAESKVHGQSVSQIHFHEVGNMDAIADITAVCCMMHELDPDRVVFSPINVGSGQVKCAHGILPVPTPATALLLSGIPSYSGERVSGELCTPTGAALAKYFAFDFGSQPLMSVEKIGYGMGKKDFEQANCVRAMMGNTNEDGEEIIYELTCNIDDMTAEEIGYVSELLFEKGALDVYSIAADMKKNRPGTLLACICKDDKKDEILKAIFENTTTLGVREYLSNRYTLSRETFKMDTPYGEVQVKKSFGFGVKREKIEYEDLAGISRRTGKPLIELKKELEAVLRDSEN